MANDIEISDLMNIAGECGFETKAVLDVSTLVALEDVRKMCEVNTCGAYAARWSCPPGCGSLKECGEKMKAFSNGILVQSVGDIEDSLDWEGMMQLKALHDKRFSELIDKVKDLAQGRGGFDLLPLADGCCSRCTSCTYPDAPCRFPDKSMSSMEAFGLYVADVCKKNNVAYNYGPGKMCYTGCLLF